MRLASERLAERVRELETEKEEMLSRMNIIIRENEDLVHEIAILTRALELKDSDTEKFN